MLQAPFKGAIRHFGEWRCWKGVEPVTHAWGSFSCLEHVFVDVAQPAVFELWDKMVSMHPGILETLSEVGFGEAPGDGFDTASC